jgi:hypothetical protein
MIMNIRRTIFSIAALSLLVSCSTNQELAQLEEYDDLYYTPSPRQTESEAYSSDEFTGANSAESSYYGESPYVEESEKPSSEFDNKSNNEEFGEENDDYYDPDYAARIENFGENNNPDYVYSDAFNNNMNPRFYGSVGMNSFNGMNRTGFGVGVGMGNPWMGNRWCDPFFDPFCNCNQWGRPGFGMSMRWGNTWGMYDPFSPYYNPYMAWNNPWANPWNNPYNNPWAWNNPYNNPWGASGVIVDGSGGNSRGFQNTPRNGSTRNARGGAVSSSSDRRRAGTINDDGPKSNSGENARGQRTSSRDVSTSRTRPVSSSSETDYYNRTDSRRYSQENRANTNTPTRSRTVNDNGRSTRNSQVTSPYTRERQTSTQQSTNSTNRYNRSNSSNSYNSTRNRTNNRNSYSSPTRSRSSSPSMSTPTRSRSTFSTPSSSPSRSSGGGGGSRRR